MQLLFYFLTIFFNRYIDQTLGDPIRYADISWGDNNEYSLIVNDQMQLAFSTTKAQRFNIHFLNSAYDIIQLEVKGRYIQTTNGSLSFGIYNASDIKEYERTQFYVLKNKFFTGRDALQSYDEADKFIYIDDVSNNLSLTNDTLTTDTQEMEKLSLKFNYVDSQSLIVSVNTNETIKAGEQFTANVSFNMERTNNVNTVFTMVNIGDNYTKTGQFFINNFKEIQENERTFEYNEITKLPYSIEDRIDNRQEYHIRFMVASIDNDVNETVHLVMVNENDDNIVISVRVVNLYKVTPKDCFVYNIESDQSINNNTLNITFESRLHGWCTTDLTHFKYLVRFEKYLIPLNVTTAYGSTLTPTKIAIRHNVVAIYFAYVFIGSILRVTLIFGVTHNADFPRFKPTIVNVFLFYIGFERYQQVQMISSKKLITYISNSGKGGYTIQLKNTGYCLVNRPDGYVGFGYKCLKFRLHPYDIRPDALRQLDGDPANMRYNNYRKRKNIQFRSGNLNNINRKTYFVTGGNHYEHHTIWQSDNKPHDGKFQLRAADSFGLVTHFNGSKDNVVHSATIQIDENINNVYVYCYIIKRSRNSICGVYDYNRLQVKTFSSNKFQRLDRCRRTNAQNSNIECIGKDWYNNSIRYKHGFVYNIHQSKYHELMEIEGYINVTTKSRDSLVGSSLVDTNGIAKVGYYGFRKNAGTYKKHDVLWKVEKDCGSKVFDMKSCMMIKEYCKLSDTGHFELIFWDDQKIPCYCDMKLDGGGWTLITNVQENQGNLPSATAKKALKVLKRTSSSFPLQQAWNFYYTYMLFKEIRLYCYADNPGRVFHISTINADKGLKVAEYLSLSEDENRPNAYTSYRVFSDDTSIYSGNSTAWNMGKWGSELGICDVNELVQIGNDTVWSMTEGLCDSISKNYTYANWKIFIR